MRWRRPLRIVRDLVRRFGILEEQVALVREQVRAVQERVERLAEESARGRLALAELRDSVDASARASTLHRHPTRVLFLVHLIEAWDGYHEVVRAMEAAPDFEPIVVAAEPAALLRSLGDPPLANAAAVAGYFAAVSERAAAVATALGLSADLLAGPDDRT